MKIKCHLVLARTRVVARLSAIALALLRVVRVCMLLLWPRDPVLDPELSELGEPLVSTITGSPVIVTQPQSLLLPFPSHSPTLGV